MWDDFFILENINFKVYTSISTLPENWNEVAASNHFLQTPYLQVLENSAPTNMECFYIGIFENDKLVGTLLSQYLDLNKLESFGERDSCLKTHIRNFIFKNFASHVLFIGNNMISGQNAYALSKEIEHKCLSKLLIDCSNALIIYFKNKGIKIHIVSFKDFYKQNATLFKKNYFNNLYEFNAQPNMIFNLNENWSSKEDYVAAFTKKYRDQYKRAHKKYNGIIEKELSLDDVIFHENRINKLYHYVAKNAPFNTFFLAENHFSTFKKQCGSRFRIFGHFLNDKLVGFHTLLLNEDVLETYFLGYDDEIQKNNMLYLNMLYHMTEFGIENHFKKIMFGRTAIEIKSSIGAEPVYMSGFILHTNSFVNKFIGKIFQSLEPNLEWNQRHPFK